ncbi:unnamed protein product [Closterium sp. NIES-64]|nr:unnamed protein product [Closterium sp. NIES-64]
MDVQRSRERFARLLAGDADGAQQLGAQQQGGGGESSRDGNDSTDPLLLSILTWHQDITYALHHPPISPFPFLPKKIAARLPSSPLNPPSPPFSSFPSHPSPPPLPPFHLPLPLFPQLCTYTDELCQQHRNAEAGNAAAGSAEAGNAEAGSAEAGNTEEAGATDKAAAVTEEGGGEADRQGSIPAVVKAAVLAELQSNGYLKAFQALISEGQGLVEQARGNLGERAEGEGSGEGEGTGAGEKRGKLIAEGGWRGELALPLLDMFGTVHRLKGRVAEWVGGCERAGESGKGSGEASGKASGEASEGAGEAEGEGERAWEQLEEEVAAAAMAALQAGRDEIMAEVRAVAAECTQLQGEAGGDGRAAGWERRDNGGDQGHSGGMHSAASYGVRLIDGGGEEGGLAGSFKQAVTLRRHFKQAVSLRRQYSKGGGKAPGAKSGKAGGTVSAGADPLTVFVPVAVSAGADLLTVFVVDRIRQFCSWDTKHALLGAHSISSAPSSLSQALLSQADTKHALLGAHSISSASSSASSSRRSSLKRLTSTPVNTNRRSLVLPASSVSATYPSPSPPRLHELPDWHDMATGMVEGLWAAIEAKAPLVASAVADSGDGGDVGKKKEEEEKKAKKKSGFFKLGGGKEGKEKGDGGGKAGGGGGGKGGKVSVQEILRGLYLFNNAAYIQS